MTYWPIFQKLLVLSLATNYSTGHYLVAEIVCPGSEENKHLFSLNWLLIEISTGFNYN